MPGIPNLCYHKNTFSEYLLQDCAGNHLRVPASIGNRLQLYTYMYESLYIIHIVLHQGSLYIWTDSNKTNVDHIVILTG